MGFIPWSFPHTVYHYFGQKKVQKRTPCYIYFYNSHCLAKQPEPNIINFMLFSVDGLCCQFIVHTLLLNLRFPASHRADCTVWVPLSVCAAEPNMRIASKSNSVALWHTRIIGKFAQPPAMNSVCQQMRLCRHCLIVALSICDCKKFRPIVTYQTLHFYGFGDCSGFFFSPWSHT